MIFLGTASAAGYPNPFCSCDECVSVRNSDEEKDIRARSSFMIDENNLIDFCSETLYAVNRYRKSLNKLRNLFITHMHEDHFDYWNMEFLNMAEKPGPSFDLYASPEAIDGLKQLCAVLRKVPHTQMREQFIRMETVYRMHPLDFYETVKIDDMLVTPMKGRHEGFFNGEYSANYVFERESGNLMYASDTGRFYEETYEWLKGHKLDTLVLEGTFGLREMDPDCGHLTFKTVCETLERLYELGVLDGQSQTYITHLSPSGNMSHHIYEKRLQERFGSQVHVAYDGLEI